MLRLVDCSLLSPPRAGPDGRSRYVLLETLRAYGVGLLAGTGEQDGAETALAGYALQVAEQAAAGLQTGTGELAAACWLDAEDATMRQVLVWATERDAAMAGRLAVALAPWWLLRGRSVAGSALLRVAAGSAAPGSDVWCAARYWLGQAGIYTGDFAAALESFTAVRDAAADRPPSPMLVNTLIGRTMILLNTGRIPEGMEDARRAVGLARELGYPAGEAFALAGLSLGAGYTGDIEDALAWGWKAERIDPAGIPGWIARWCDVSLIGALAEADDVASAWQRCADLVARARQAGDLPVLADCVGVLADLDRRTGRIGEARAHLREALQTATRTGELIPLINGLDYCGDVCAATGRWAEAVTVWAAHAACVQASGLINLPSAARLRQQRLRKAGQALGPARVRAAGKRGAAMSLATAAEYALMLTDPSPQQPQALPGPGQLSARERELVTLVAQGRTDAQIAAQLYISVRTVSSHLDRIRDKTSCRRRADLTRLALTTGLV